ncbi:MAG TPA: gas vesicle protein [Nocardioidaceae bacterium]|nr:gas vesicle protein [Nocardioidaceae bacterium]
MATARKTASSSSNGTKKTASRRRTSSETGATESQSAPQKKKVPAMKVARTAAQQLAELTGREPECVIGIQRTEDGWQVDLEVVESRRIPDSTDILATYSVETDEDGDLMGYQRVRRYVRGKGGDGDGGRR